MMKRFVLLLVFTLLVVGLALSGCKKQPGAPDASFTVSTTSGGVPFTVNFTDTSVSTGAPILSWHWLFGDGAESTEQNPSHLYAAAGVYNVSLTVTNVSGDDTELRLAFITASSTIPVVTSFAIDGGGATVTSRTVTLNNACTGGPAEYMASESLSFAGAAWQAYGTGPSFTLSLGNGAKTVYFKVRNALGESASLFDTITLNDPAVTMLPGDLPLELVWISPGSFQMGSPDTEADREDREGPQHAVTISNGFWMGKYELTKAQWEAVMGTTPWSGQLEVITDPDSPAVWVTWNDTQSFTTTLNGLTGQTFRLPTEAEWEYSCRAETTSRFYWGDDLAYVDINGHAWWSGNALESGERFAHAVGQKLPNARGLYDMSGNVWEWCQDTYHSDFTGAPTDGSAWDSGAPGDMRIYHGGSWNSARHYCRSAGRSSASPMYKSSDKGFRLVRVP